MMLTKRVKVQSKQNSNKDWKTDIKNWQKISEQTAKLMLEQSESVLKETTETAKGISARAERIISILIPITTALVAYLFSKSYSQLMDFLPLTAILCLTVAVASLVLSYINFEKYSIAIPGDYPDKIVRSVFIDNTYNEAEQYVNMILSICENIQRRISINEKCNAKRTRNNTMSLRVLFGFILCPVLAYFLSHVFL